MRSITAPRKGGHGTSIHDDAMRTKHTSHCFAPFTWAMLATVAFVGCASDNGEAPAQTPANEPATATDSPTDSPSDSSTGQSSPSDSSTGQSSKGSPTGKDLITFVRTTDAQIVIAERKGAPEGLGRSMVTVDDKPVWPPTGNGCEALISCCNEQSNDEAVAMACQFAIARDKECGTALGTVTKVVTELGKPPGSCSS